MFQTSLSPCAQKSANSFGIAFPSLVPPWFLGGVNPTDSEQLIAALHRTYLLLGGVSVLSAATFLFLKPSDGGNVSGHVVEGE